MVQRTDVKWLSYSSWNPTAIKAGITIDNVLLHTGQRSLSAKECLSAVFLWFRWRRVELRSFWFGRPLRLPLLLHSRSRSVLSCVFLVVFHSTGPTTRTPSSPASLVCSRLASVGHLLPSNHPFPAPAVHPPKLIHVLVACAFPSVMRTARTSKSFQLATSSSPASQRELCQRNQLRIYVTAAIGL
jgi:hypothetical protein